MGRLLRFETREESIINKWNLVIAIMVALAGAALAWCGFCFVPLGDIAVRIGFGIFVTVIGVTLALHELRKRP